jgi:hypothetical protein
MDLVGFLQHLALAQMVLNKLLLAACLLAVLSLTAANDIPIK